MFKLLKEFFTALGEISDDIERTKNARVRIAKAAAEYDAKKEAAERDLKTPKVIVRKKSGRVIPIRGVTQDEINSINRQHFIYVPLPRNNNAELQNEVNHLRREVDRLNQEQQDLINSMPY